MAGRGRAFVAATEDEPRGGDVQREAQQRREQQQGRKAGEVERPAQEDGDHEHEYGRGDGEREADVEKGGRERDDEDSQQCDNAKRQADVGAGQVGLGFAAHGRDEGLHRLGRTGRWWYADAGLGVVSKLVPKRAYRDAEDDGGVGAIAERVPERFEDEVALDLLHRATD